MRTEKEIRERLDLLEDNCVDVKDTLEWVLEGNDYAMYHCPYDHAIQCNMLESCCGCEDFRGEKVKDEN